ncbi:hypothetical protein HK102_005142, partial [Quaeritorhiza haematococci]
MGGKDKSPEDYVLRVKAGPSYDLSKSVFCSVNDEFHPVIVDSENFCGYILIRMRDFDGYVPDDEPEPAPVENGNGNGQHKQQAGKRLPIKNPPSDYFKGRNRRYSIMVQGRFKKTFNANDILFGVDFDTPVRSPPGSSLVLKMAKLLDPNIEADITCSTPWGYSPWICAMNSLGVFPEDAPEVQDMWDSINGPGVVSSSASIISTTSTSAESTASTSFFKKGWKMLGVSSNSSSNASSTTSSTSSLTENATNGDPSSTWHNNKVQPSSSPISTTTTMTSLSSAITSTNTNRPLLLASPTGPSKLTSPSTLPLNIGKWSFHSRLIPEKTQPLVTSPSSPSSTTSSKQPDLSTYDKRKKYFSDPKTRSNTVVTPDHVYCMDFYDAYFDFGSL